MIVGGSVTDEITECSVLVTDKIRCTMKILSAIARGCPIVDVNWLKHSYTVKMFQGNYYQIILFLLIYHGHSITGTPNSWPGNHIKQDANKIILLKV